MGKHAQLVIGPAGSGKSTYCSTIYRHCEASKRAVHVVNLDPAAEHFDYPVSIDVRELITLDDAMEEMGLGPNGGLVFCLEYLAQQLDWLQERVQDFGDDYLLLDCPGQIELYSHLPVMPALARALAQWGYQVVVVYCVDSLVAQEPSRLISGMLMCLSAMVHLELPHLNVLTKCDLLESKKALDRLANPDVELLVSRLDDETPTPFQRLNRAVGSLIEEYSMVNFVALDVTDEESVEEVLAHADHAIQYGEDLEVKEPRDLADHDDSDAQWSLE